MSFIIEDWAGNVLFDGRTFETFEDAWSFIYENDPFPDDDSDNKFDDYEVVKRGTE